MCFVLFIHVELHFNWMKTLFYSSVFVFFFFFFLFASCQTHKACRPLQGVGYNFSRGRCHLLLGLKKGYPFYSPYCVFCTLLVFKACVFIELQFSWKKTLFYSVYRNFCTVAVYFVYTACIYRLCQLHFNWMKTMKTLWYSVYRKCCIITVYFVHVLVLYLQIYRLCL